MGPQVQGAPAPWPPPPGCGGLEMQEILREEERTAQEFHGGSDTAVGSACGNPRCLGAVQPWKLRDSARACCQLQVEGVDLGALGIAAQDSLTGDRDGIPLLCGCCAVVFVEIAAELEGQLEVITVLPDDTMIISSDG